MRKLTVVAAAVVAALGVAAAAFGSGGYGSGTTSTQATQAAASETYTFKATLTAGQEVPKPNGAKRTAAGNFSATTKEKGSTRTFHWTLTFRNLTGKALAAHVHMGKKGVAGAVVIALCGPCKSGQTGTLKISEAAEAAMEKGTAYVNVHTKKNANGEIRGQIRNLTKE
jgi:hypothetical protein